MAMSSAGGLRARWEGLSERERLMVSGLTVVALMMIVAAMAFVVRSRLGDLEDDNTDMRRVLKEIEQNRDSYQRLKQKSAQVESRLGHGGVQLEGLLEAAANQSDLEISETNPRPAVQVANKNFTERAVDLRLRKVTIDKLAHFLRRIETGPSLVVVTALSARVRDDKHEELEVEMTVSTWERVVMPKKAAAGGNGGSGSKENGG